MYVADWSRGIFQKRRGSHSGVQESCASDDGVDFKVSGSGRSEVPCNITTAEPHDWDKLVEGR